MDVLMPQLGETVTEGTISRWHKAVGDGVAPGEPLFDIETDKTSMEVPAVTAGVLSEIRAQAGAVVPVGSVIAVLTDSRGAKPGPAVLAAPAVAQADAPTAIDSFHGLRTPKQHFGKAALPDGRKITPLARRLAAQAQLDVVAVKGSGPHGRIIAADVRSASARGAPSQSEPAGAPDPLATLYEVNPFRTLPLDGMRRTIARRLTESKQQVPHFYVSADINVDSLLALRKQIHESQSTRVSINDLFVKAYALALQQVEAANVVWAEDRLLQFSEVDIGVAVAIPGGLVTPIIRKADTKPMMALASELAGLIARARDRKLQPPEYLGGTATISNLGMFGVRSFQAIVNPPQATILAIGAAERRPFEAADGSVRFGSVISVTLSVDHRAVDGTTAGELLSTLRGIVENPLRILL
jgi:pyruvate dehydrogenase E2 component (dihydrolipoamide acetyltransferase)